MTSKRASTTGRRPREVVADTLRERIRSGEFEPGDRLPTQRQLETEFGVGRSAVREALAALTQEGLLDNVGRGSSPTVAEPRHQNEAPRIAGVELTDRLHVAFQAEDVTIDAFSLTTETLNNALAWPVRQIMDGQHSPRSVTARILIPSLEAHLALPRLVENPDDPKPRRRLHRMQSTYVAVLQSTLASLTMYDVDVSVTVQTVPLTPTHKLYLLNGDEALIGYYQVVLNEEADHEGEQLAIYDVLGLTAKIFRSTRGPDARDEQESAFVEESQLFFDSLWNTIATPFTLE
ncbi:MULTISPECIES: GntR family transcriptional regulator [unclassified Streptomyces]|uniref:GntR family transcriptional regulator n=1 Tax=unclassified Streptomyces TaxID=2593676 RepID=UPI002DDBAB4D|nr:MULTISPECIES: GntR family transcriptional regulator [unclassified Streptomyces]WSA93875.1 GntR family transcriptional regulator [Streptomyces sp. NBC_01795]WSB78246.1 GntR family transcriptional regulator [Streptomyces sp. NBC_01775]WSS13499.1 GntR family transcriptional regulator [Streptomyces sp. NBC_01186]WSS42297.1 GntR family transcriptional regulator [Streptomyces sp. NBC_01187]